MGAILTVWGCCTGAGQACFPGLMLTFQTFLRSPSPLRVRWKLRWKRSCSLPRKTPPNLQLCLFPLVPKLSREIGAQIPVGKASPQAGDPAQALLKDTCKGLGQLIGLWQGGRVKTLDDPVPGTAFRDSLPFPRYQKTAPFLCVTAGGCSGSCPVNNGRNQG